MIAKLTPTELRVVKLLASGHMPSEIARKTNRSVSTISTHITRMKQKLQAHSTIQVAVMWATQLNGGDMEYLSWTKLKK